MTVLGITCIRNEAPYVVDWIAHHRALGIGRFLIFSHDCDDGTDRLLDALDCVTHIPFKPRGNKTVQWQALKLADRHPLVISADWVLFFDVDEYLNLPEPMESVTDITAACGDADGIAIPWRLFGAAGRESYEDTPVTRRFCRAAPVDIPYPLAVLFKSLHRPQAFRHLGVHRPRHRKAETPAWRLANGEPLVGPPATDDRGITLFGQPGLRVAPMPVLNHYSVRSAEEFMLKSQRGLPNHADRPIDLAYWAERNFNAVEDTSIARFADAAAAERAELMAAPDIAALHEAGADWHRAQIAAMVGTLDGLRMRWRLGLLAASTPPPRDRAARFIQAQVRMKGRQDG